MKKSILNLLFLSLLSVFAYAQDSVYYYYGLEKIYLQKENNVKIIHFIKEPTVQLNQLRSQNMEVDTLSSLMYRISGDFSQKSVSNLFAEQRDSNLLYMSDMLLYEGSMVWESDKIIIKIFPNTELEPILKSNNIPYKEFRRLGSNPQTYLVTLDASLQSAIVLANYLVENQSVEAAQPSFYNSHRSFNPLYPLQWGLKNTGNNSGQYNGKAGVDIKAEQAWALGATGSGIKVAVIDDGVDLEHPDLIDNLLPGYDATDGEDVARATNGGYGGGYNNDAHGTRCAGIIAGADNGIGIKGIAYNVKIIPIRTNYNRAKGQPPYAPDESIVNGIRYAWENGADILSCSWSRNPSLAITNEIDSAVTYGRNGKGCVVVVGSGNSNSSVAYPAYLPKVIAVGAINQCGERKRSSHLLSEVGFNNTDPAGVSCDGEVWWGSCYGSDLDIVAPGVNIYTTDIEGGYDADFNGTSAACAYVAGVAALVLSVNSNFKGQHVRYLIESTAQKIRPDLYTYSPSYKYYNDYYIGYLSWYYPGTGYHWDLLSNPHVGYGLVDVYAAVHAALCPKPVDLIIGDTPDDAGMEPNLTPELDILNSPNIWVKWDTTYHQSFTNTLHHFVMPNQCNYINVRIKNIGCSNYYTGGAHLNLYWAKAGTDLNSPANWNLINASPLSLLSMFQGQDYIKMNIPWYPPNLSDYKNFTEPRKFYLMAKIESVIDTMTYPDSSDFINYVINNNNVACRSVEIGSDVDLMIKRTPTDIGAEPFTTSTTQACLWNSPNIWVRHTNDGFINQRHENPDLSLTYNYVYVKIKNIGNLPYQPQQHNARLHLYWAKAGTSLSWDYHWTGNHFDPNDRSSPLLGDLIKTEAINQTIASGGEIIMEFKWEVPDPTDYVGIINDPWHFCLLARIEANSDPILNEGEDLYTNVNNNNNIAWKNVHLINTNSGNWCGVIGVGNVYDEIRSFDLQFTEAFGLTPDFDPPTPTNPNPANNLFEEAEITIKLNETLFNAWQRGGMQGADIKLIEEQTILITGENARLQNITFEPYEMGVLNLCFNFLTQEVTNQENYAFHVVQTDVLTNEVIGGEVYDVSKSLGRDLFYADAEDVYAFQNDPVVLTATDIGEPAIYNWYDVDGDWVCEEQNFETIAERQTTYKLEVIALSDGYKDYTEVAVKIVPGKIEELFPNPTSDQLNVVCVFNKVASANITISSVAGIIFDNVQLDTDASGDIVVFNTSNYPIGTYTVTLICDGKIACTKTFVKH